MAGCQTKDYEEMLQSLYSHTVPLISSEHLMTKRNTGDEVTILDIRSKAEYEVSHIAGARMIDYDNFRIEDVDDIPKEADIIVYCSVGYRSEKVGEQLQEHGFRKVRNLYGGIFQWKNEGFDVVNQHSNATDSIHTYSRRWSKWLLNGVRVY